MNKELGQQNVLQPDWEEWIKSLDIYLYKWNDSFKSFIKDDAIKSGNQYLGKHGWDKRKLV